MQGIKTSSKGTFKSGKLSLTEKSVLLTKIKEIYLKYLTNTFIFTFHTMVFTTLKAKNNVLCLKKQCHKYFFDSSIKNKFLVVNICQWALFFLLVLL